MNITEPVIIEKTNDYAVVFKPPKTHSISNRQKKGDSLIEWHGENGLPDNGLLHRLDYETHGLVLFAKNPDSYEFFKNSQDRGEFIKEYSAVCLSSVPKLAKDGFPPSPDISLSSVPVIIMSYFRPYGAGRKEVRPVTEAKKHYEIAKDNASDAAGGFYRTEIISVEPGEYGNVFTVRIKRGFRHQIRCHLSWIGCPILNDPLYGGSSVPVTGNLALRAHALFFTDPSTGNKKECRIEKIMV